MGAQQAQEGKAQGEERKAGRTGQNPVKDPEDTEGVQGEAQQSSAGRPRHGEDPQERAGTIRAGRLFISTLTKNSTPMLLERSLP